MGSLLRQLRPTLKFMPPAPSGHTLQKINLVVYARGVKRTWETGSSNTPNIITRGNGRPKAKPCVLLLGVNFKFPVTKRVPSGQMGIEYMAQDIHEGREQVVTIVETK